MKCPFILDVVLAVMVIVVSILLVIIFMAAPVWTRLRWFIEDLWYMVKKEKIK